MTEGTAPPEVVVAATAAATPPVEAVPTPAVVPIATDAAPAVALAAATEATPATPVVKSTEAAPAAPPYEPMTRKKLDAAEQQKVVHDVVVSTAKRIYDAKKNLPANKGKTDAQILATLLKDGKDTRASSLFRLGVVLNGANPTSAQVDNNPLMRFSNDNPGSDTQADIDPKEPSLTRSKSPRLLYTSNTPTGPITGHVRESVDRGNYAIPRDINILTHVVSRKVDANGASTDELTVSFMGSDGVKRQQQMSEADFVQIYLVSQSELISKDDESVPSGITPEERKVFDRIYESHSSVPKAENGNLPAGFTPGRLDLAVASKEAVDLLDAGRISFAQFDKLVESAHAKLSADPKKVEAFKRLNEIKASVQQAGAVSGENLLGLMYLTNAEGMAQKVASLDQQINQLRRDQAEIRHDIATSGESGTTRELKRLHKENTVKITALTLEKQTLENFGNGRDDDAIGKAMKNMQDGKLTDKEASQFVKQAQRSADAGDAKGLMENIVDASNAQKKAEMPPEKWEKLKAFWDNYGLALSKFALMMLFQLITQSMPQHH